MAMIASAPILAAHYPESTYITARRASMPADSALEKSQTFLSAD
jgi:hypothetical protein